MKTIIHAVNINGSTAKVFDAIGGRAITDWWSTKVEANQEVGSHVRWTFEEGFNPVMEIEALEPDRLVRWRCIDGHEPWQDNTFEFAISESDVGGTLLQFRQEYAQELDDVSYGIYNFNWGYYLESLRLLVAEGKGKPYTP